MFYMLIVNTYSPLLFDCYNILNANDLFGDYFKAGCTQIHLYKHTLLSDTF